MSWSNPVYIWWLFLVAVSVFNIAFWFWSRQFLFAKTREGHPYSHLLKSLVVLSGFYVFGCAFRAVLPRVDVQRMVLFDSWFSNVFLGRSVATVAELAFVMQWALILGLVARESAQRRVLRIAQTIVPAITIAEIFSWSSVITTSFLGHVFEESLWGITYFAIAICLIRLRKGFSGAFRSAIEAAIYGCFGYVVFMFTVDVPMYFVRWRADVAADKTYLGFLEGLHDLLSRWDVNRDILAWKPEIPWLSLYFSFAVFTSLALCYVPLYFKASDGKTNSAKFDSPAHS